MLGVRPCNSPRSYPPKRITASFAKITRSWLLTRQIKLNSMGIESNGAHRKRHRKRPCTSC